MTNSVNEIDNLMETFAKDFVHTFTIDVIDNRKLVKVQVEYRVGAKNEIGWRAVQIINNNVAKKLAVIIGRSGDPSITMAEEYKLELKKKFEEQNELLLKAKREDEVKLVKVVNSDGEDITDVEDNEDLQYEGVKHFFFPTQETVARLPEPVARSTVTPKKRPATTYPLAQANVRQVRTTYPTARANVRLVRTTYTPLEFTTPVQVRRQTGQMVNPYLKNKAGPKTTGLSDEEK